MISVLNPSRRPPSGTFPDPRLELSEVRPIAWRFLGERVAPLQVLGGVFGVASVAAFALGA